MWARFTVLNETPIASAIAGCVIPLSRSNTIWMRSRCAAGIFHRSAVFSSRICFLVHLTIRPPESDSQSESYPAPSRDPEKRQKSLDSNSYGSGMRRSKWLSCCFIRLRSSVCQIGARGEPCRLRGWTRYRFRRSNAERELFGTDRGGRTQCGKGYAQEADALRHRKLR